jgi:5-methylcytosine-specific restriction endonuclease McrA
LCGIEYSTRRPKGEGERFCSRSCSHRHKAEFGASEAQKAALAARCALVSEVAALKRIRKNWAPKAKIGRKPNPAAALDPGKACKGCGSRFTPRKGQRCCDTCRESSRRSARRASKKKHKSVRRARQAIQAQSIDPIKVFERDRWKCHLCGREAPARLRGTNDPRAPELDHVVSLAHGGNHTWANVACSCRRCNGRKGAASVGQLNLGFAV